MQLVCLIVVSLGLLAALAIAVNRQGLVIHADLKLGLWTRTHMRPRILHAAGRVFQLGDPGFFIPFAALSAMAIAWWRRSIVRGLAVVATVGLASALSALIKALLPSHRPAGYADMLHAFPSTHTTATATLLGTIAVAAFVEWNQQTLALMLAAMGAVVMGAACFLFRAHWPSDVVGGLLLATAAVSTVRLILAGR